MRRLMEDLCGKLETGTVRLSRLKDGRNRTSSSRRHRFKVGIDKLRSLCKGYEELLGALSKRGPSEQSFLMGISARIHAANEGSTQAVRRMAQVGSSTQDVTDMEPLEPPKKAPASLQSVVNVDSTNKQVKSASKTVKLLKPVIKIEKLHIPADEGCQYCCSAGCS